MTAGVKHIAASVNARRAFTLIEMLVAAGIIAILASLLAASLGQSKATARSAACKNNLRQLGLALQMYVDEQALYPGLGAQTVSIWLHTWPARLLPYASGGRAVFNCPASPPAWHWQTSASTYGFNYPLNVDVLTPFSYGYNATIGGLGGFIETDPVRPADVVKPVDMIAIGDSSGDPHIQYHASTSRFGRQVLGPPGLLHANGANIVFCDGHVEWRKQARWIQRNDPAARQWHRDNQPHPEVW